MIPLVIISPQSSITLKIIGMGQSVKPWRD
jgi:hypothetical protein